MFILGQPKSISELPMITDEEVDGFCQFLDKTMAEGTPIDGPSMMMTLKDLGRMMHSLRSYRDLAKEAGLIGKDGVRLVPTETPGAPEGLSIRPDFMTFTPPSE